MKNLLITTIGDYNHSDIWMKGNCNYDIVLIDYRITPVFKYPGIYKHLMDNSDLLKYDYYWMPDEDVNLSSEDINKLFELMSTHKLDLAQPSIEKSNNSFPSWEFFVHKNNIDIIYSNFIEITCPCFSRDALGKCLPTFIKSKSGWGLDLVWPSLIGDNSGNIAIINNIIARITRKTGSGLLYEKLKKESILPSSERKRIMREYGIKLIDMKIYAHLSYSESAK